MLTITEERDGELVSDDRAVEDVSRVLIEIGDQLHREGKAVINDEEIIGFTFHVKQAGPEVGPR